MLALGTLSLGAIAAADNQTGPAFAAFVNAYGQIDNYSETIVTHEVKGSDTQDRIYTYKWKKPAYASIAIDDGPGKGGGAVWHGGDKVRGHQGGFFSGIKLIINIHDPRATSLRGDTIEVASFDYEIKHFQTTKGSVTEAPGPSLDGSDTDAVTLNVADPASNGGVTKDVLYISRATHLPVKREQYEGANLVKSEIFKDRKINPGLTTDDFE